MSRREIYLIQLDNRPRSVLITKHVQTEIHNRGWQCEVVFAARGFEQDHVSPAEAETRFEQSILDKVVGCIVAKKPIPTVDYILVGSRNLCDGLKMGKQLFAHQSQKHGWVLYEIHSDQNAHHLWKRTADVLSDIANNQNNKRSNGMKTRKEINEILEAIHQSEESCRSIKENMVQYCISVEKMTEEEAGRVVDEIIRGTSDFTNSLDSIHGKTKEDISHGLIARLDEKLKDLTPEDVDKILQNIFLELSALSIDQMQAIASNVGDNELKETVLHIRSECNAALEGKTYEEKLALIAQAVQNCGSLSALLTLAEDKKSFTSATSLDDAISVATLNGAENTYVMDEIGTLRIKNYTALAEYLSARHGTHPRYDSNTPAYNIGVSAAADVEKKKIRVAALAGMITFDNAVKLLGTIAVVAFSLMLAAWGVAFTIGMILGSLAIEAPIMAGILGAVGFIVVYEGTGLIFDNRKKIGNVLAAPVIGIKNLAVRLIRGFCNIFNIPWPNTVREEVFDEDTESVRAEEEEETEDVATIIDDGEEEVLEDRVKDVIKQC